LRGVNAAVPAVASGIRISLRTSEGQPVDAAQASLAPIPVQVNPLFNPTLNYSHFLLAALMPALLQIVIVTTMAYTVGLDGETHHRLRILRRLGGGLWPAMLGKFLPYTFLFLLVLGLSDIALFDYFGMPLRGHRALLIAGAVLFILANQMVGALLALLLRPVASAVSIATLLFAPAFGFMGIGFPRLGMNGFAYWWGELLPGTWYLSIRIDQTLRGTPVDISLKPIAALLFLTILFACLTALRLQSIRIQTDRRNRAKKLVEQRS
jgi:ABC-2 type transport system permease protein